MIRQYGAQRCLGGFNPLRAGPIAVGSIYILQDESFFNAPLHEHPYRRESWVVEGFLNGVCAATRYNSQTRQWEDAVISGRSDQAMLRSLGTGRRRAVSVRLLLLHDDHGLCREAADDPPLPDLSLYRRCLAVMQTV